MKTAGEKMCASLFSASQPSLTAHWCPDFKRAQHFCKFKELPKLTEVKYVAKECATKGLLMPFIS